MKKNRWILPLAVLFFILFSCNEFEDANFGIGIETCDHRCGENSTCQTSRGDLENKEKASVSFPYGNVYQDGTRDYPETLGSINATLTVTVEGEGIVKVTVKPSNGNAIEKNASNGNPAVITADFPLEINKVKPNEMTNAIESADIVGIQVETVDGPATDVQLNMVISECTNTWCTGTNPTCQSD